LLITENERPKKLEKESTVGRGEARATERLPSLGQMDVIREGKSSSERPAFSMGGGLSDGSVKERESHPSVGKRRGVKQPPLACFSIQGVKVKGDVQQGRGRRMWKGMGVKNFSVILMDYSHYGPDSSLETGTTQRVELQWNGGLGRGFGEGRE